jgi:Ca-activated chloride channel family protein
MINVLPILLAVAPPQAAENPTFGTSIVNVFVDAFVTSRGEPVTGLGPDDFEVRDEGVVQRLTVVKNEQVPLYAVLAFDTSESVSGEKLKDLVTAGQAFLAALTSQDRVSLLTFSHELLLRSAPGAAHLDVVNRLAELQGHGATSLYDAADAALTLATQEPHALVLLFTDGVDTSSWLRPEQVLKAAERSTSVVYAVGTDPEAPSQSKFLKELAETTGGRVFWAGSTRNIAGVFLKALADIRSRYLLGYEPTGPPREGWHTLAIRLRNKRGVVRARRGYFMVSAPR